MLSKDQTHCFVITDLCNFRRGLQHSDIGADSSNGNGSSKTANATANDANVQLSLQAQSGQLSCCKQSVQFGRKPTLTIALQVRLVLQIYHRNLCNIITLTH